MSSAEALQRFEDGVLAAAYAGEQLRRLQNTTIVDEDGQRRIAAGRKELTPEAVVEEIYLALEINPRMLDREDLDAFEMRLFAARLGAQQGALVKERPRRLERPNDGSS